jgi:hypothetical protein
VPKILEEYFASVGGRQNIFTKSKRTVKKRRRASAATVTTASRQQRENGTDPTGKASPNITKPWTPPVGSWEDAINRIDACEKNADGGYVVYLVWKNGKKTKHATSVVYQKCPQKVAVTMGSRNAETLGTKRALDAGVLRATRQNCQGLTLAAVKLYLQGTWQLR